MINATEFVKQNKLGRYVIRGEEVEIGCPFKECANYQEPQFYININNGAWYCHRCNRKGINLKRLQFALGLVDLQEPVKSTHVYIPEQEIEGYQQALFTNKKALEYLMLQRGFEKWVIKQFRLGYKTYDGSPVIVIPYFDKIGSCVGMKYDFFTRPSGVAQKYTKEKGTKTQFYNLDNVDLKKPLVITEGEYDTIAGYQYGMENIGSLPNGSQGVNGWTEEISEGEKFILCLDNDASGQEGSRKLGRSLGQSKCSRVYPRAKDLSEALQVGYRKDQVEKWFKDEEPMFTAPITDITSYLEKAEELLNHPEVARGVSTGWHQLDYFIGGVRNKEITVVSGRTGNGKTTFGVALVGNLMRQGMHCLVISPEMREEKLLLELANNHFRTQVDTSKLSTFVDKCGGLVHLANMYGSWTDDKEQSFMSHLFDVMEYSVKNQQAKFIFIDHLRLFTTTKEDQERREIDEFMKRCVRFAMLKDVHIMVVVQPRKLDKSQRKVTGNDLKGSVNIEQDAHNVLLIHREENSDLVEFDLEKNRELGTIGSFKLRFNKTSMANYEEVSP